MASLALLALLGTLAGLGHLLLLRRLAERALLRGPHAAPLTAWLTLSRVILCGLAAYATWLVGPMGGLAVLLGLWIGRALTLAVVARRGRGDAWT